MILEGLNAQQLSEIYQFICDNHQFGMVPQNGLPVLNIKYVDTTFDTRTKTIGAIKFRGTGAFVLRMAINHFSSVPFLGEEDQKTALNGFSYTSLYEWVMAYLKGDWTPTEEFLEHWTQHTF